MCVFKISDIQKYIYCHSEEIDIFKTFIEKFSLDT